ncbi:histidine kinase osmosensor [Thecaphora frezii]
MTTSASTLAKPVAKSATGEVTLEFTLDETGATKKVTTTEAKLTGTNGEDELPPLRNPPRESSAAPTLVIANSSRHLTLRERTVATQALAHLRRRRYNDESGLSAQEELRLLKAQVQDIVHVCKAVAFGDLTQHITVPVQGHVMVELKDIINQMVDRLSNFAAEVKRVSLEVGTQGKLGGQAEVEGVEGTWEELKDVVNRLAANLMNQVRGVALVTKAVARGDLSKKIEVEADGEILELKVTLNVMVDQLRHFANEVTRVSREAGSRGQLGGQANVPGVQGVWKELTINVNRMCSNLTEQVRSIGMVTTAVAKGDLTKMIDIDAEGEMAQLKDTVNSMVGQLRIFASEVVRMSMEVGTYGKLGGQAHVPNVEGTWKDLTENVNKMADNLTLQARAFAQTTAAATDGVFTRFVTVEASGEMDSLKTSSTSSSTPSVRRTARR